MRPLHLTRRPPVRARGDAAASLALLKQTLDAALATESNPSIEPWLSASYPAWRTAQAILAQGGDNPDLPRLVNLVVPSQPSCRASSAAFQRLMCAQLCDYMDARSISVTPGSKHRVALAYAEAGRTSEALRRAEEADGSEPDSPDGLMLRAWLLQSLGKWSEAEMTAEQLLSIEPDNDDGRFLLARQQSDVATRKAMLQPLVDRGKTCWHSAVYLASAIGALGDVPGAINELVRLGAQHSAESAIPHATAHWLLARGDTRDANRVMGAARRIGDMWLTEAPGDFYAGLQRVDWFSHQREMDKALREADRLVRDWPDVVDVWTRRANLFAEVGSFEKAAEDWAAALRIAPDSRIARLGLGMTRVLAGELDGARDIEAIALGISPTRLGAGPALGHAFMKLGRFEAAEEHFRWLSEQLSPDAAVSYGLAVAQARGGQPEVALDTLAGAIKLAADPVALARWARRDEYWYEIRSDREHGARFREVTRVTPAGVARSMWLAAGATRTIPAVVAITAGTVAFVLLR